MTVAPAMATDDYVGFTFFVGCMAMMAASAFFFLSMNSFDNKWKTSILVSGLITFIAAVHYWYMRDYWATNATSPTFFRYVDWTLTVPLMCVEFYLLTKPAGASRGLMWKLIIASVWMLVAGYIGEAFNPALTSGVASDGTSHSVMWGVISTLGYLYVLHAAWFGEVAQLAEKSDSAVVKKGVRTLAWFVLVGWAIYPIGYMCMPGGWLSSVMDPSMIDVWYNLADAINKIGFGLVVYHIATSESK